MKSNSSAEAVIVFVRADTRVGMALWVVPKIESEPVAKTTSLAAVDLARHAALGDAEATGRLLRLLAPEIARVVRGVMGPHSADADDAVQQSLIALIHALPAYRAECSPAGYACRIAFRTALAFRKRRVRSFARQDASSDADDQPTSAGITELSEARRRTELVRSLLDDLPPEQAEALALRSMLGWSLDEIAQAGGSPLNTIRSRLRLAKEALRRKIEADPGLADELGVER
jgi:RNA polymerase sigma-70 factor (ECF subfamily)